MLHAYEKGLCPRCWEHAVGNGVCQSCGRRLPEGMTDTELGEFINRVDMESIDATDDGNGPYLRTLGDRLPWLSRRSQDG